MPSTVSRMLQDSLKPYFKSEGFRKKSAVWGAASEDLAKFFNIQCSRNSKRVYFNIGIYLQSEGKVDFPRELDCHLRFRLEQLLSSDDAIRNFCDLCDFENCSMPNERVEELSQLVIEKVIPWFRKLNTVADVLALGEQKPGMYWNNGKQLLEESRDITT